jgi:hypothetical protein
MNASDVLLNLLFNLTSSPEDADFTDQTNYAVPPSGTAAVDPNFVTGYLKLEGPTGIFLNNLNTGATLGTPTVLRYNTTQKLDIPLPLDASGDVVSGLYTATYQSRVWDTVGTYSIISIDSGIKTIKVSGDQVAAVTAALGQYFLLDGTAANDGIITPISATLNAGNTDIVVSESVASAGAVGNFLLCSTYTDYQAIETATFDFTAPTTDLDVTLSCQLATLTGTDNTDSRATNNGTLVSPAVTARTMTFTAPVNPDGTGFTPTTTTTALATYTIAGIWTGDWTVGLLLGLTYNINSWLSVYTEVQGTDTHTVDCDSCACTYFTCIDALNTKYLTYKTTNKTRAQTIKAYMIELNWNWMLYQMAEQCGYDSTEYCNKIEELAQADNCTCSDPDADTISTAVVAWGSGGGGTTVVSGSAWYNNSGVPSGALGNNGDYYLDDDNGNYYTKTGGVWLLQGTLKPVAPAWLNGSGAPAAGLGNVGDYYIDNDTGIYYEKTGAAVWTLRGYLSKLIRLEGDVSDDGNSAGVGLQTLKSYNIPADSLQENGEEIVIETYVETTAGAGTRLFYIEFGSSIVATHTYTAPGNIKKTYLRAKVLWNAATSELASGLIKEVTAPPNTETGGIPAVINEDETASITVSVKAQTSDGGANDIVAKYLTVDLFKKQ